MCECVFCKIIKKTLKLLYHDNMLFYLFYNFLTIIYHNSKNLKLNDLFFYTKIRVTWWATIIKNNPPGKIVRIMTRNTTIYSNTTICFWRWCTTYTIRINTTSSSFFIILYSPFYCIKYITNKTVYSFKYIYIFHF